jgi:hypothetical protein
VSDSPIDVRADVSAYFQDAVQEAVRARSVEASAAALHYLVGLLSDFARPERGAERTLERPVTLLLREALEASGAERFERLRTIGDGVLYGVGFFGGALARRGADTEYVMSVGSCAYDRASEMLRIMGGGPSGGFDVLHELALKFGRFVEVIREIADGALASGARCSSGLLRLYERWQQTGSERLAAELGAFGVFPARSPGGVH